MCRRCCSTCSARSSTGARASSPTSTEFGAEKGLKADWAAFTDDWRGLYQPAMDEVRSGRRAWTILDVLHRESLDKLLAKYAITGLSEADKDHINRVWHRLKPWPDTVEGLHAAEDALHHRHALERQRRPADAHGQERRPAVGRGPGRGDGARLQAAAAGLSRQRRAAQSRARAGDAGGGPQRRPRRRRRAPACAPPSSRGRRNTVRTRSSTSRPTATGTWSPTASQGLRIGSAVRVRPVHHARNKCPGPYPRGSARPHTARVACLRRDVGTNTQRGRRSAPGR